MIIASVVEQNNNILNRFDQQLTPRLLTISNLIRQRYQYLQSQIVLGKRAIDTKTQQTQELTQRISSPQYADNCRQLATQFSQVQSTNTNLNQTNQTLQQLSASRTSLLTEMRALYERRRRERETGQANKEQENKLSQEIKMMDDEIRSMDEFYNKIPRISKKPDIESAYPIIQAAVFGRRRRQHQRERQTSGEK